MSNFFKEYRMAYMAKHSNDEIKEDLTIPKNTGVTVPNPKTLKNNKKPIGKFVKKSEEE